MRSGDLQRVQELITSGEDVNPRLSVATGSLLIVSIRNSYKDIALALLEAGADVHAKGARGRTALHLAGKQGLEEVVQALIDRGSRVDEPGTFGDTPIMYASDKTAMLLLRAGASCEELSMERRVHLFRHACAVGDLLNVRTLLKNGCSVSTLSKGDQEALLHCACREGDTLVAETLVTSGCDLSSLSREEMKELLHHACREGNFLVATTLLELVRSTNIVQTDVSYLFDQLKRQEKEALFRWICFEGNLLLVEALLAEGCNVNCVDSDGITPLMSAAREGNEKVVKALILAGANLEMESDDGSTALHYAASRNHIQCGVLLAEAGASGVLVAKAEASMRTEHIHSETVLYIASVAFTEAITQARFFTTRKTLCIIGNSEGGKSTLIASLQAESTGLLGRIFNRFRRVSDHRLRTAGIEPIPHSSQKYGEVLFFDFAGQDDYHGPHQMFLESLLSKPGVSMTILLVVKMTEEEDAILHQLHRWLTPVALMATPANPPHVIIIGSFLDKVRSKDEATARLIRCILATKNNLVELPLRFVGTCFLNCRQPQSEGVKQLCTHLQDIPIPEFSAAHAPYSLAWVLSQIKSSFTDQAVQLKEFSKWVQDNKDNLPQTMPPPEEVCQDLSAAGHALYLPNKKDPPKSWLVLDLASILHDVYGTLFSNPKETINEFGLLHCCRLKMLFPDLDLQMVKQLLISLEFCISVDPSVLKVDLIKLTQSKETSGWLFFPALISAKPPQLAAEGLHKQSVHCLRWQLRTSKKHSISARILQTILLRLAAHFVVKHHDEEGVQHCCSIWWNGISWQSNAGVDVTFNIMKNRVIQVIATSTLADELFQYWTEVVSDVLSTVRRLSPNLAAAAYIVHPPKVAILPEDITTVPQKELFPVQGVQDSIRDHKEFVLSLKDTDKYSNRMTVIDLFVGCTPSLEDIERIIWTQPVASQLQLPTEPEKSESHFEGNGLLTDSRSVLPGAQALLDISSKPDIRDVDELVVTEIAADWERVALKLGVEVCVSKIILKDHPNDYMGVCLDMLDRWLGGYRHTGEEERTWATLLAALGRAGFGELERRLRREHVSKQ